MIPNITERSSWKDARRVWLGDEPADSNILRTAADGLIESIGGNIQQESRNLPRLCNKDYSGRFPYDNKSQDTKKMQQKLPEILWDERWEEDWKMLPEKLKVEWFCNSDKKEFDDEEAKKRWKQDLDNLENENKISTRQRKAWEKKIAEEATCYPRKSGGPTKQWLKFGLPMYLIFSRVETSKRVFELLRKCAPEPRKTREKKLKKNDAPENSWEKRLAEVKADGRCPIRQARGERKFIFPYFTDFEDWANVSRKESRNRFNIEAFAEALKTVNQFKNKGEERDENRKSLEAELAVMNGKVAPTDFQSGREDNDDEPPHVLHGDERFSLVQALIKEELAIESELTEGERVAYSLHGRTLKGFGRLKEKWHRLNDPNPEKLREKLKEFQQKEQEKIGSMTLFTKLTEEKYWCLWQEPSNEEAKKRIEEHRPDDMLSAYARYLEIKEDIERLKEPIRYTPAHAQYSPRHRPLLSNAGMRASQDPGHHEENKMVFKTDIALRNEGGEWGESVLSVSYSAPRLYRDKLRDLGEESNLQKMKWLQPMMEALGFEHPDPQDFSRCPASLMSKGSQGERRYLVNFPMSVQHKLLIKHINTLRDNEIDWSDQFFGPKDEPFALKWPDYPSNKQPKEPWWEKDSGSSSLGVDLGQRDAAAWSLLRVLPEGHTELGERNGSPLRALGKANGKIWYAQFSGKGLLRLPGENCRVLTKGGTWEAEPYGRRGRLADDSDWEEAKTIVEALAENPEDLLGKHSREKSFPEHNDALLRALRWEQSWLYCCQRWHRFLVAEENTREQRDGKLKRLQEELKQQKRKPDWEKILWDKPEDLKVYIRKEIDRLRNLLPKQLERIANRVLPLRGRKWSLKPHPSGTGWSLLSPEEDKNHHPKLMGQRGLSLARIEQIEDLRRRCQSLNRILQSQPGEAHSKKRGESIPDPCPNILEKLRGLKEQRVNQTAHLIVARALGVRLSPHQKEMQERLAKDIHGEYERIPGAKPVDFIVMEDLTRYRMSQERSRRENRNLMKWCHRAILDKVKMLCEPFGISVIQTQPAFSSRFCCVSGAAGFRAEEITLKDRFTFPWKNELGKNPDDLSGETLWHNRCVRAVFEVLDKIGDRKRSFVLPKVGGKIFLTPKGSRGPCDADENAATNIGLRAIASPQQDNIHVKIRTRTEKKRIKYNSSFALKIKESKFGGEGGNTSSLWMMKTGQRSC